MHVALLKVKGVISRSFEKIKLLPLSSSNNAKNSGFHYAVSLMLTILVAIISAMGGSENSRGAMEFAPALSNS
jgi:predicted nucleotide-binding protein (sugar kinase/HSP70/actin superfamily)